MPICLEVWGDYALFTRPEMKVERVSYDVMTPSAARGLIEAIYWHPGLRWTIDRIPHPLHQPAAQRNKIQNPSPDGTHRYGKGGGTAVFVHLRRHSAAGRLAAAGRTLCDRSPF